MLLPQIDTIVALSTPYGHSAIAILRLSGENVRNIIKNNITYSNTLEPRKATLGQYIINNEIIDEIIFIYYNKNHSYTGEDMLEINCHGNPLIIDMIIDSITSQNCRIAMRGEFTRKALMNGKIDLSQAEAIKDLIEIKNKDFLNSCTNQLKGGLTIKINSFIKNILNLLSQIEAFIDFPEEDIPIINNTDIENTIKGMINEYEELKKTFFVRKYIQKGLKIAILGAPNVGKSSLMNFFMEKPRSIVNKIPGTTRDYIEETIMFNSHFITLIDTAGVRETIDEIEQDGIKLSIEQIKTADLLIIMEDETNSNLKNILKKINITVSPDKYFFIKNKIDLLSKSKINFFINLYKKIKYHAFISIKNNKGLNSFKLSFNKFLNNYSSNNQIEKINFILNKRHISHIDNSLCCFNNILSILDKTPELSLELISIELKSIYNELTQIIGLNIDNQILLDKIFENFCIGK